MIKASDSVISKYCTNTSLEGRGGRIRPKAVIQIYFHVYLINNRATETRLWRDITLRKRYEKCPNRIILRRSFEILALIFAPRFGLLLKHGNNRLLKAAHYVRLEDAHNVKGSEGCVRGKPKARII